MQYTIFTDGSYKKIPGIGEFYSGAATIQREGESKPLVALTKVCNDDMVKMHNVAGEIIAVVMAFEHCLRQLHVTQDDIVILNYDYVGIENWTKKTTDAGYWRAKNQWTQAYREYMNREVRTATKVIFHRTPGHSGIAGNEIVDRLARNAIDEHVNNL